VRAWLQIVPFWLLLIFWTAETIAFNYGTVTTAANEIAASGFPSTTGQITSTRLQPTSDDENTTYSPVIAYQYEVNGIHYEGSRYRYGSTLRLRDSTAANSFMASHAVTSPVEVFYRPTDPSDAVLNNQLAAADFVPLVFLLPFLAVLCWFWRIAVFRYLRIRSPRRPSLSAANP